MMTTTSLSSGQDYAGADLAYYDSEDEAIPPGHQQINRTPHFGLLISGAALFGVAYIASVTAAAVAGGQELEERENRLDYLFIPVVGPFVAIDSDAPGGETALLAIDGAAQLIGVSLFAISFAVTETIIEPMEYDDEALAPPLFVAPTVGRGFSGVTLTGSF